MGPNKFHYLGHTPNWVAQSNNRQFRATLNSFSSESESIGADREDDR